MTRLGKGLTLTAIAAALIIALAACGGESDSAASGGGEKTRYSNAQYGFELAYGEPLDVVTINAPEGEEYAIAFADKDGALVDDQYVNGLRVSVLEVSQTLTPADVKKFQKEITHAIEEMVASYPNGKATGPVAAVEVNGTPGFVVDFEYTQGGEQVIARSYILIKGDREYHLTSQTVAGDWDSLKGTLEEAVQTFTLD